MPGDASVQTERRVGIAIQGGVVPAGAFAAGVLNALIEKGAFDTDAFGGAPLELQPSSTARPTIKVHAFSGTSAGAAIAALCWSHLVKNTEPGAPSEGFRKLREDLIKQWTFFQWPRHSALVPIWYPSWALVYEQADALCMQFPLYAWWAEHVRTPYLRWFLTRWFEKIGIEESKQAFESRYGKQSRSKRPGLAMASADILRGDIKIFREEDLSLAAVMACGSLYDMGGATTIVAPPHEGTYLDGAWADNPPINELLDYGINEIWLIQCFRKSMPEVPKKPVERRERKDELWQNSLVEHELEFVGFVNKWAEYINDGVKAEIEERQSRWMEPASTPEEVKSPPPALPGAVAEEDEDNRPRPRPEALPPDARLKEHLREHCMVDGKLVGDLARLFDVDNDLNPKSYQKVAVHKIEIGMPRELGSAILNAPWFIRNLMRLGYEQGQRFAENGFRETPAVQLRPARWGTIPAPVNDFFCGVEPAGCEEPKPFMKGPVGDALELVCDFCPRKAASSAGELLMSCLPKEVQQACSEADDLVCKLCWKTHIERLAA